MRKSYINWLYVSLFFALLATLTFRCSLPSNLIFESSDVNLGGLAFRKDTGWDLFSGYFNARPLFGNTNYSISLFNVFVQLVPLYQILDLFYPLALFIGSIAMVWYLRIWSIGWIASVIGAIIAFWFNSILLASSGHVYKIEVLVFSVLSLALIEKCVRATSVRNVIGYAFLTGLSVGLMMLEQQDVALLAGLFLAPYAIFRFIQIKSSWVSSLSALFLIGIISLLFSGPVLLRSYDQNIRNAAAVQEDMDQKWNYITQWSLVPEEWPDLIAPGWSGWSTHDQNVPYWGEVGRSASFKETGNGFRNFKLDSTYIGILPFLFAFMGLFFMIIRNADYTRGLGVFWLTSIIIGFFIACGKYSVMYKYFFELPLLGDIRAPIKLLDNIQIGIGILGGFGLHSFSQQREINSKNIKWLTIVLFIFSALILYGYLSVSLFEDSWRARFTNLGFGNNAEALILRMETSWLHALIFLVLGSISLIFICKKKVLIGGLFLILLLSIDSVLLTSKYFRSTEIDSINSPNAVLDYLKENQSDERVAYVDQQGIYNQWLAVDGILKGLNYFNIWQMNRMPAEYNYFLRILGSNQLRIWELASVRWISMPRTVYESLSSNDLTNQAFNPELSYTVPTAKGLRNDYLVRYKNSVPRFALYNAWDSVSLSKHCDILKSQSHNPLKKVLLDESSGIKCSYKTSDVIEVDPIKIDPKHAKLEVVVNQESILRFSQRYQPGWTVWVNGKQKELLRLDYLVMGVYLEQGEHIVEFRCPRHISAFYSLSIGILVLISGSFLIKKGS